MKPDALVWFSPISIVLGLAISVLQLYVTSRQAQLKEKIIEMFRDEMAKELKQAKEDILKEVDYKVQIAKGQIVNELNNRRN